MTELEKNVTSMLQLLDKKFENEEAQKKKEEDREKEDKGAI